MIKSYPSKKFTCAVALTLVALIGAGCGKARVDVFHEAGDNWDYPKSVAILPFSFDSAVEENKSTHSILRKTFFNYFSYLGYNDIPLNTVDLKLDPIMKTGVSVDDISTGQLMKVLEVDAVIRGHIINATNLTAGIYASRQGLKTAIMERMIPGNQIINVELIVDYPGFVDGISGAELVALVLGQAQSAGVEFFVENIGSLARARNGFLVKSLDETYKARAVIVATGSSFKKLGVPGEEEFNNKNYSIKNLTDGNQKEISFKEIVELLRT